MAKKLTPEEAIRVIRKGLEKCRGYEKGLFTRYHAYDSDKASSLIVETIFSHIYRISVAIHKSEDYLKPSSETHFIPFPWRAFIGGLQEITEYADKAITVAKIDFSRHDWSLAQSELSFYLTETIRYLKSIKEEIVALLAICKQFAK